MPPATPTLNGQVLGEAERATRAILDRLLNRTGTTFTEWVALNLVSGTSLDRDQIAARMAGALKIDVSAVLATLAGLTDRGLLAAPSGEASHVVLTDAGRARHGEIRSGIDEITARLYGDLPPEDLATAGRVLTVVTARANAELAGA